MPRHGCIYYTILIYMLIGFISKFKMSSLDSLFYWTSFRGYITINLTRLRNVNSLVFTWDVFVIYKKQKRN